MESKGKVIAILDRRDGVSAKTGKAWATQSFVIETNDQYPVKQCFEVFGVEKVADIIGKLVIGAEVQVSFDIESRDWKRQDGSVSWITTARAWKVEGVIGAGVQQAQNIPPQQVAQGAPVFEPMDAAPEQEQGDGLPF